MTKQTFSARVANVERELKDAIEDPDWVYSEPEDITALLACIKDQRAALKALQGCEEHPGDGPHCTCCQRTREIITREVLANWWLP